MSYNTVYSKHVLLRS